MKKLLLIICVLYSFVVQAKVTADFTPNPARRGDTVVLTLSSDKAFSGVPNIDILKQDFSIGGQQQRQSAQWINGKGQNLYQLVYTLFPNKSGTIRVHGLTVGNEVIPDFTLTVQSDPKYDSQEGVDMTVQCPHTAVYPDQKLLCSVYLDDSVGILDGQLVPPSTDLGTWEQILPLVPVAGGPAGANRYQSTFAFTPKSGGSLHMNPFLFQGTVRMKGNARSANLFDFMLLSLQSAASKPVQIQSKPFTITVKNKPAEYRGWWLPSTQVVLSENYQMPDSIKVGEPIVRTVTLTASDAPADHLPVPEAPSAKGFKVYINPEQRQDTAQGGQVSVVMTFVPTDSGTQTLPAIQVPWFDVTHEKTATATLPERQIFVLADEVPPPSSADPSLSVPTPDQPPQTIVPVQTVSPFPWVWLGISLLIAFLLGLGVAFLFLRKVHSSERKKKKPLPDLYPF